MHASDSVFIDNTMRLFGSTVKYKISETQRRYCCVISDPPLTTLSTLRQIVFMRPCQVVCNVRDGNLRLQFYKTGEEVSKKRVRDVEPGVHPFAVKVSAADQPVIDSILNWICGQPYLCLFEVVCTKSLEYDLRLDKLETVSLRVLERIMSDLSTFVSEVRVDFPLKCVHFTVKRNDSL